MTFPDPVALNLGPLEIRWYALAYIAGILLGWFYASLLLKQKALWPYHKPMMNQNQLSDFVSWAMLAIIIGGRLGYVFFYNPAYYIMNPFEILAIWQGGMSFHGGLLGIIIATYIFAKKHTIPLLTLGDIVAATAPIGLFFGRLANFINAELWGKPTNTSWGIIFPNTDGLPRHPSQLYEASSEGLLLFILCFILIKIGFLKRKGFIIGLFLIGYGSARFAIEFVREPDKHIGLIGNIISMGQILSIPMILTGFGFIIYALKTPLKTS